MSLPQYAVPLVFSNNIDLENLESQQDLWIRQYENSRRPPPPPRLNSPRSLRACELCSIDPDVSLAKYSLRLHLNEVLGSSNVEAQVEGVAQSENIRLATQDALRAFQRASIGMGTSKEKLLAYRSYRAQEAHRPAQLAAAREVRRQILAEETFERRRQQHLDSAELRTQSNASAHGGSGPMRESSWSSVVAAGGPAHLTPTSPSEWVPPTGEGSAPRASIDAASTASGPSTTYRSYSPAREADLAAAVHPAGCGESAHELLRQPPPVRPREQPLRRARAGVRGRRARRGQREDARRAP
ncbi:hypothetical protein STCU_10453 [Strigomonas culicis]|uniref:Uncharacterized protein n=1 Tax=Strigomonas culicis TaxID=28005 RepID=S9UT38_9TRYP|nr:hypothetical protein STCU_10453 [Strigomonas culicis]|eukprot:EPY17711.1 hypothetical protein STCU_10453 [Strigomonas culicis]